MARCRKLLELALRKPTGLRFADLCRLDECFGFVLLTALRDMERIDD